MQLSPRTASFALAHTDDPWHAAHLVDSLKSSLSVISCNVGLPREWVLAKQRESIDMAVFAIDNCNDPDTLDAIIGKSRRKGVLAALARNRHLSDAGYERLRTMATLTHNYSLSNALPTRVAPTTPEQRFDAFLEQMAVDPDTWATHRIVENRLRAVECPLRTEMADRVLRELAAHEITWGVSLVLQTSLYETTPDPARQVEYLNNTSYSPLECLDMLCGAQQDAVLRGFLSQLSTTAAVPVDLELVERMAERLPAAAMDRALPKRRRIASVFSDEAIEFLLNHPTWHEALCHHDLDAEQLDRLAEALGPERMERLFERSTVTRDVLAAVLPRMIPGSMDSATLSQGKVLPLFTGPDDPLLVDYLRAVVPRTRIEYLRGAWSHHDSGAFLPTLEELAAALDECADDPRWGQVTNSYANEEHPEHGHMLMDRIPGFAWIHAGLDGEGSHVYQRLLDTGAERDFALAQFDANAEHTTLDHLCDTLASFAKLQS